MTLLQIIFLIICTKTGAGLLGLLLVAMLPTEDTTDNDYDEYRHLNPF